MLGEWRRRLASLPRSPEPPAPVLDASALLADLITALRQDTAAGGAASITSAELGSEDAAEIAREIGALRSCLHASAAAHGLAPHDRAAEILHRELDRALCRALLGAARREASALRHMEAEQRAFLLHDLRAPLNAISLAAATVERARSTTDDARVHKMLRSVRRNIEQLSLLLGRALDASILAADALPEPDLQHFELRPLVGAVAENLEPLAHAGGTRIANTVPERLVVHADAWLLARVFQNLLANAIEHTPGGEIIVGAEATLRGESVVCWVRDDGVGIAESESGKIFRKGEATRPRHGARGFGLPIVEQVVEAHGGRVAVESAAGFGATFWFELPASGPAPPPAG